MTKKSNRTEKRRRGGFRRPLAAFCNFLGSLILLSVIVTFLPLVVPRLMGYEVFNVISPSMTPDIPEGSVVYVKPLAPETVEEGDVIAFWSGNSAVTHRVVKNRLVEGEFITKGDANEQEDISPVPYGTLIGRVERHFPVLGQLMALYTSNVGKIYVFCFAASGLILNVLAGRIRDRDRWDDEE